MRHLKHRLVCYLLFGVAAGSLAAPCAHSHGIADQVFLPPDVFAGATCGGGESLAQSFVPESPLLIGVDLRLLIDSTDFGASTTINILAGDLADHLVLASGTGVVPPEEGTPIVHYHFDSPVDLVVGETYFIEYGTGRIPAAWATSTTGYAPGEAFDCEGNPLFIGSVPLDFHFATYAPLADAPALSRWGVIFTVLLFVCLAPVVIRRSIS